jgi:hypothetical protein
LCQGSFITVMDKGQREVATTIVFDNAIVKNRIKMIINGE